MTFTVGTTDRSLVSLDGTLIPSQEFTEQTGYSGKHWLVGRSCRCWWAGLGLHLPSAWPQAITTMVRSDF